MMLSRLVIGVALVGACKKAESPEPTTPERPTSPTTTPPPAVQPPDAGSARAPSGPPLCSTLSRAACLESDHCTLVLLGNNVYRCRADEGPCEIGLRQGDRKACEAKPGCAFDTGTCYCPCEGAARTLTVEEKSSGCACVCGGGAPSMCNVK